jgi:hypothetical protein
MSIETPKYLNSDDPQIEILSCLLDSSSHEEAIRKIKPLIDDDDHRIHELGKVSSHIEDLINRIDSYIESHFSDPD